MVPERGVPPHPFSFAIDPAPQNFSLAPTRTHPHGYLEGSYPPFVVFDLRRRLHCSNHRFLCKWGGYPPFMYASSVYSGHQKISSMFGLAGKNSIRDMQFSFKSLQSLLYPTKGIAYSRTWVGKSQFTKCSILQVNRDKKKRFLLILPCRYDQGAFSSGHELADSTLGKLAAYL
jgi:hypothetical protein